ncbi:MAG: TolB family protein [Actinomycetota bacterium]
MRSTVGVERRLLPAILLVLLACPSREPSARDPVPIDFSDGIGCAYRSSAEPTAASGDRYKAYTVRGGTGLFVRDALTGEHVSLGGLAVVSRTGRFIAISSGEVHTVVDTKEGKELPVSTKPNGEFARFLVVTDYPDSISANGGFVAFHHGAPDIVAGDGNNSQDVFVRDLAGARTVRVSIASNGTEANAESRLPAISADGNVVAFISQASNLVPGDVNGHDDIFVHDRMKRETVRITDIRTTRSIGPDIQRVSISGDGRFVVFSASIPGIVPGDSDGQQDVFIHDLRSRRTMRVSERVDGRPANARSVEGIAPVSHDGSCVMFASGATNLVEGETNSGIFVRDLKNGRIIRVSDDPTGAAVNPGAAALFSNGKSVAFEARGRTFGRDLLAGKTFDAGPADPLLLGDEPQVSCYRIKRVADPPILAVQPPGFATGAAYTTGRSLGLYSTSPERSVRVLDTKVGRIDDIQFRSQDHVTFELVGGRAGFAFCELNLGSGRTRELFRDVQLHTYDWSPDGTTLAYIGFTEGRIARAVVYIWSEGQSPRKIADLGPWHGNGHLDEHREDQVAWSRDGERLLVGTGFAGGRPAVRVMDRTGRLVRPMVFGTLSRWLEDSVIYRDFDSSSDSRESWHVMDENGVGDLSIEPGTVRPAVSPDGRYVVVDDAGGNARLIVYDAETGTQSVLARGYITAVWLSPGSLSVVKVEPCETAPHPDPCAGSPAWRPIGSTRFTIDIDSGRVSSSRLPSSRDFDVLYARG